MDPIAICGSALNVLNKIKEQLKECSGAQCHAGGVRGHDHDGE
jgi:hypothetical protein